MVNSEREADLAVLQPERRPREIPIKVAPELVSGLPQLFPHDSRLEYLRDTVLPTVGEVKEVPEEAFCDLYLRELEEELLRSDTTYSSMIDILGLKDKRKRHEHTNKLVRKSIEYDRRAIESTRAVKDLSPERKCLAAESAVEEVIKHELVAPIVGMLGIKQIYKELEDEAEDLFLSDKERDRALSLKREYEAISRDYGADGQLEKAQEVTARNILREINEIGKSISEKSMRRPDRISKIREQCMIPQANILPEAFDKLMDSANLLPDSETRREMTQYIEKVQGYYQDYRQAALKLSASTATVGDFREAKKAYHQMEDGLGGLVRHLGVDISLEDVSWPLDRKAVEEIEQEVREGMVAQADLDEDRGAFPRRVEFQELPGEIEKVVQLTKEKAIEEKLVEEIGPLVQRDKPQNWATMALLAQEAQIWFEDPPEGQKPLEDKDEAERILCVLDLKEAVLDELLAGIDFDNVTGAGRPTLQETPVLVKGLSDVTDQLRKELKEIVNGKRKLGKGLPGLFKKLQDISVQIGKVVEGGEVNIETLTLAATDGVNLVWDAESKYVGEQDHEIVASSRRKINKAVERSILAKSNLAGEILKKLDATFTSSKLAELPVELKRRLSYQLAELMVARYQVENQEAVGEFIGKGLGRVEEDVRGVFRWARERVWKDTSPVRGSFSRAQKAFLVGGLALTFAAPVIAKVVKDVAEDGDSDLSHLIHDIGLAAHDSAGEIWSNITPFPQIAEAQGNSDPVVIAPTFEEFEKDARGTELWGTGEEIYSRLNLQGTGHRTKVIVKNTQDDTYTTLVFEEPVITKNYVNGSVRSKFPEGEYEIYKEGERPRTVTVVAPPDPEPEYVVDPDEPAPPMHVPEERPVAPPWLRHYSEVDETLPPEISPNAPADAEVSDEVVIQSEDGSSGNQTRGTVSGQNSAGSSRVNARKVVPAAEPIVGNDPQAMARVDAYSAMLGGYTRQQNQAAIYEQAQKLEGQYCLGGQECIDLAKQLTGRQLPRDINYTIKPGDTLWSIAGWLANQPGSTCGTQGECMALIKKLYNTGDERSYNKIFAGDTLRLPGIAVVPAKGIDPQIKEDMADKTSWRQEEENARVVMALAQEGDPEAINQWENWQEGALQAFKELEEKGLTASTFIVDSSDGGVTIMAFTDIVGVPPTTDPDDPRSDNKLVVLVATIDPETGEFIGIEPHKVDEEEFKTRLEESQSNLASGEEEVATFLSKVKWKGEIKDFFQLYEERGDNQAAKEFYEENRSYIVTSNTLFGGAMFAIPEGAEVFDSEGLHFRLFSNEVDENAEDASSVRIIIDFAVVDGIEQIVVHTVSQKLYQELLNQAQENYEQAQIGLDEEKESFRPAITTGGNVIILDNVPREELADPDEASEYFWKDLEEINTYTNPEDAKSLEVDRKELIAKAIQLETGGGGLSVSGSESIWQQMETSDAEIGTSFTTEFFGNMGDADKALGRNWHNWEAIFNGDIEFDWASLSDGDLENLARLFQTIGYSYLISKDENRPEKFDEVLANSPHLEGVFENIDQVETLLRVVNSEVKIRKISGEAIASGQIPRLPTVVDVKKDGRRRVPILDIEDEHIISSPDELVRVAQVLNRQRGIREKEPFLEFFFTANVGDETPALMDLQDVYPGPVIKADKGPSYPQVYETKDGRKLISLFVPNVGPEKKGVTIQVEQGTFDQLWFDEDYMRAFLEACVGCNPVVSALEQQFTKLDHIQDSGEAVAPVMELVNAAAAGTGLVHSLASYYNVVPGMAPLEVPPYTRNVSEEMRVPPREEFFGGAPRRSSSRTPSSGETASPRGAMVPEIFDPARVEEYQRAMAVDAANSYVEYVRLAENLARVEQQISRLDPNAPSQRAVLRYLNGQRSALVEGIIGAGAAAGIPRSRIAEEARLQDLDFRRADATQELIESEVPGHEILYNDALARLGELDRKIASWDGRLPEDPSIQPEILKWIQERGAVAEELRMFSGGAAVNPRQTLADLIPSEGMLDRVLDNVFLANAKNANTVQQGATNWPASATGPHSLDVHNGLDALREAAGERLAQLADNQENLYREGPNQTNLDSLERMQDIFGLEYLPLSPELLPETINYPGPPEAIDDLPTVTLDDGRTVRIFTLPTAQELNNPSVPGTGRFPFPNDESEVLAFINEQQRMGRVVYWDRPPSGQPDQSADANTFYKVPRPRAFVSGEGALELALSSPTLTEILDTAQMMGLVGEDVVQDLKEREIFGDVVRDLAGGKGFKELVTEGGQEGWDRLQVFFERMGWENAQKELARLMAGQEPNFPEMFEGRVQEFAEAVVEKWGEQEKQEGLVSGSPSTSSPIPERDEMIGTAHGDEPQDRIATADDTTGAFDQDSVRPAIAVPERQTTAIEWFLEKGGDPNNLADPDVLEFLNHHFNLIGPTGMDAWFEAQSYLRHGMNATDVETRISQLEYFLENHRLEDDSYHINDQVLVESARQELEDLYRARGTMMEGIMPPRQEMPSRPRGSRGSGPSGSGGKGGPGGGGRPRNPGSGTDRNPESGPGRRKPEGHKGESSNQENITNHDLRQFTKGVVELTEIVDKYGADTVASFFSISPENLASSLSSPDETSKLEREIRGRAREALHYQEWSRQAEGTLSRINEDEALRSARPNEGLNFQYRTDREGNITIIANQGKEAVALDELSCLQESESDKVPRFSTDVYVDPDYRNRGYAKNLFEYKFHLLKAEFPGGFILETVVENQKLREKIGASLVGAGFRVTDQDGREFVFDSRVDTLRIPGETKSGKPESSQSERTGVVAFNETDKEAFGRFADKAEVYTESWGDIARDGYKQTPEERLLVHREDNGEITGSLEYRRGTRSGKSEIILTEVVDKERGIGRSLVESVLREAAEEGWDVEVGYVGPGQVAVDFYKKMAERYGGKVTGTIVPDIHFDAETLRDHFEPDTLRDRVSGANPQSATGPELDTQFENGVDLAAEGGSVNIGVVEFNESHREAYGDFIQRTESYRSIWGTVVEELGPDVRLKLYVDQVGTVVGALVYGVDSGAGEIFLDTIEVTTKRLGVGTALMESVLYEAAEAGMNVRGVTDREAAIELYRKLTGRYGGEEVGRGKVEFFFRSDVLREKIEEIEEVEGTENPATPATPDNPGGSESSGVLSRQGQLGEIQQPDIERPDLSDRYADAVISRTYAEWVRQVGPQLDIDVEKYNRGNVLASIIGDDAQCFHMAVYESDAARMQKRNLLGQMDWEANAPETPAAIREKLALTLQRVSELDWGMEEEFNQARDEWYEFKGWVEDQIAQHPDLERAKKYWYVQSERFSPYWTDFLHGDSDNPGGNSPEPPIVGNPGPQPDGNPGSGGGNPGRPGNPRNPSAPGNPRNPTGSSESFSNPDSRGHVVEIDTPGEAWLRGRGVNPSRLDEPTRDFLEEQFGKLGEEGMNEWVESQRELRSGLDEVSEKARVEAEAEGKVLVRGVPMDLDEIDTRIGALERFAESRGDWDSREPDIAGQAPREWVNAELAALYEAQTELMDGPGSSGGRSLGGSPPLPDLPGPPGPTSSEPENNPKGGGGQGNGGGGRRPALEPDNIPNSNRGNQSGGNTPESIPNRVAPEFADRWRNMEPEEVLSEVAPGPGEKVTPIRSLYNKYQGYGVAKTPSEESIVELFEALSFFAKQGKRVEGFTKKVDGGQREIFDDNKVLIAGEVTSEHLEVKLPMEVELVPIEPSEIESELARVAILKEQLVNGILKHSLLQVYYLRQSELGNDPENANLQAEVRRLEGELWNVDKAAFRHLFSGQKSSEWLSLVVDERVFGLGVVARVSKENLDAFLGEVGSIESEARDVIIQSHREGETFEVALARAQQIVEPVLQELGYEITAEKITNGEILASVSAKAGEGVISLEEYLSDDVPLGVAQVPTTKSVLEVLKTLEYLAERGYSVEGVSKTTDGEILDADNILIELGEGRNQAELRLPVGLEMAPIEDAQAEVARVQALGRNLVSGYLLDGLAKRISGLKDKGSGQTEAVISEIGRLEGEKWKAHELGFSLLGRGYPMENWLGNIVDREVAGFAHFYSVREKIKSELGEHYKQVPNVQDILDGYLEGTAGEAAKAIVESSYQGDTLKAALAKANETFAQALEGSNLELDARLKEAKASLKIVEIKNELSPQAIDLLRQTNLLPPNVVKVEKESKVAELNGIAFSGQKEIPEGEWVEVSYPESKFPRRPQYRYVTNESLAEGNRQYEWVAGTARLILRNKLGIEKAEIYRYGAVEAFISTKRGGVVVIPEIGVQENAESDIDMLIVVDEAPSIFWENLEEYTARDFQPAGVVKPPSIAIVDKSLDFPFRYQINPAPEKSRESRQIPIVPTDTISFSGRELEAGQDYIDLLIHLASNAIGDEVRQRPIDGELVRRAEDQVDPRAVRGWMEADYQRKTPLEEGAVRKLRDIVAGYHGVLPQRLDEYLENPVDSTMLDFSEFGGDPDNSGGVPPEPSGSAVNPEPEPDEPESGGGISGPVNGRSGSGKGVSGGRTPDKSTNNPTQPESNSGEAENSPIVINYHSDFAGDQTTITTQIVGGGKTLGTDSLTAVEECEPGMQTYLGEIAFTADAAVERNTRRLLVRREALMRQQFPDGFVVRQEVGEQNAQLENELLRLGYRKVEEGVFEFDSRQDAPPLTRISTAIGRGEQLPQILAGEDLNIVGELLGYSVDELEAYIKSPESHPNISRNIRDHIDGVQQFETWERQFLGDLRNYNSKPDLLAGRPDSGITYERHPYGDRGLDVLLCEGKRAIALNRSYITKEGEGVPNLDSEIIIDPLERGRNLTRGLAEQNLNILKEQFPEGFIHTPTIGQLEFPEKLGKILQDLGYKEIGNNTYQYDSRWNSPLPGAGGSPGGGSPGNSGNLPSGGLPEGSPVNPEKDLEIPQEWEKIVVAYSGVRGEQHQDVIDRLGKLENAERFSINAQASLGVVLGSEGQKANDPDRLTSALQRVVTAIEITGARAETGMFVAPPLEILPTVEERAETLAGSVERSMYMRSQIPSGRYDYEVAGVKVEVLINVNEFSLEGNEVRFFIDDKEGTTHSNLEAGHLGFDISKEGNLVITDLHATPQEDETIALERNRIYRFQGKMKKVVKEGRDIPVDPLTTRSAGIEELMVATLRTTLIDKGVIRPGSSVEIIKDEFAPWVMTMGISFSGRRALAKGFSELPLERQIELISVSNIENDKLVQGVVDRAVKDAESETEVRGIHELLDSLLPRYAQLIKDRVIVGSIANRTLSIEEAVDIFGEESVTSALHIPKFVRVKRALADDQSGEYRNRLTEETATRLSRTYVTDLSLGVYVRREASDNLERAAADQGDTRYAEEALKFMVTDIPDGRVSRDSDINGILGHLRAGETSSAVDYIINKGIPFEDVVEGLAYLTNRFQIAFSGYRRAFADAEGVRETESYRIIPGEEIDALPFVRETNLNTEVVPDESPVRFHKGELPSIEGIEDGVIKNLVEAKVKPAENGFTEINARATLNVGLLKSGIEFDVYQVGSESDALLFVAVSRGKIYEYVVKYDLPLVVDAMEQGGARVVFVDQHRGDEPWIYPSFPNHDSSEGFSGSGFAGQRLGGGRENMSY